MNFLEDTPVDVPISESVNTLWVEKYRPNVLADYIGNEHLKSKLTQYIDNQDVPHILLAGTAGTGKSSCAKLLVKSIKCDSIYINASDENSVETVRTKIKNFASSLGFNDMKIVILDECLDENTLVWVLRNGEELSVSIREVDDTCDLVKSYNTSENKIEWMPFDLFDKGNRDVYQIELENGESVICTDDHKWYVEDEFGKTEVVKTKDLHQYNHILSP